MSNQVIPNTDQIEIARIAATLHALEETTAQNNKPTLDKWLENFDKAYKAISTTVGIPKTTATGTARSVSMKKFD
jgi:hypothetical protein